MNTSTHNRTTSEAVTTVFDEPTLQLLEEHVRRLLSRMGFEQVSLRSQSSPDRLLLQIDAGEYGKLLIGSQGTHLLALQHIIRTMLRRQVPGSVRIIVDVNGYRDRREKNLIALAENAARRATIQGKTVVLQPMGSAERRTIHTALASRPDIRTESLGDEPNRRVVIKPIFL